MKNKIAIEFKAFFLLFLFMLSNVVSAQYFGRNKVQYENFDFKVLKTENFDIHYYPEEYDAANDAGYMLERWRTRQNRIFGNNLKKPQPIILYANHSDFQQTNAISGRLSQATGGVTEGYINRVVIPMTGVNKENNHVLGHELVHAYQYNIMKIMGKGFRAMQKFPLWFIEGMAEYLSIGRRDPHTAMWMRDAVLNDNVPSIEEAANSSEYFPYRYGHAIWNFIVSNYGDKSVDKLYRTILQNNFNTGMEDVLGISVDSLSTLWEKELKETYSPQVKGLTKPQNLGQKILGEETRLNLAPVLSPNGRYIAVITSKSLFTLDLYILDANTGRVIRKLASSETDSHFDALRFTNSAGTWSPEGDKFAYVVIEEGDNKIAISNVETGNLLQKFTFPEVTSIMNLAWSPDGNKIAFSGNSGGFSDLYLYDLEKKKLRQLTDDKYSEIMPSWGPLNNRLTFVTDEGGNTDASEYKFGNMRLGILNLKTGQIKTLAISSNAKHINPHFSPGGGDLLFVADPDGISNLYRYSFDKNEFYKITNIATGISGLTELSPAMSVAKNTGDVAVSVFHKSKYLVRKIDGDSTQGTAFKPSNEEYVKAVSLPPTNDSNEGIVQNYMEQKSFGLTASPEFNSKDYEPSLKLLNVGRTAVGVTVDRFGTGIGGGTSITFSDMLGNHYLSTAVQASGTFKDIGGQAFYQNRKRRYNWGASVGHIPYLTGRIFTSIDTVNIDGQQVLARNNTVIRQRVFSDRLNGMLEYPLSQNRRFEFSLGYNRISYDTESRSYISVGSQLVDINEDNLPSPDPLNLFKGSAAYVGDYSYFGFTSPVNGSRYRLEVEPTFGSLKYLTVMADYRKYFFFNPITLAFRGLHYGRYLEDADNQRLSPLQVGYRTLVRGYNIESFSNSEFAGSANYSGYNRLIGSKIGVANIELRIPLFGTQQFGLIDFPIIPTELTLFGDAGVAWTNKEKPVLKFAERSNERVPVFSSGIAARINILGYAVGQFYYAYPFQRPDAGWQFGFVLSPGW